MAVKILIADDDVISCLALKKKAQDWGYEVFIVHNGEEAWQLLQQNEIRLAILDWKMPGMDGTELCRKIRDRYKHKNCKYTYIIMLTARGLKEDRIKGLASGADDYMTKPASFIELKVRLKNGERIIELEDNRIRLASFDGLTNLWNRNKIIEFFEEELERGRRDSLPTGIILVDIDNFKQINDTLGHFAGDKVLAELANRMKNRIRRYDKIGRYGGDEILVVLSRCDQDCLQHVAERLRLSICSEKFRTKSGSIQVTVSLGAVSSEDMRQAKREDLIQASDRALYMAKRLGRNRLVIAESTRISKKGVTGRS